MSTFKYLFVSNETPLEGVTVLHMGQKVVFTNSDDALRHKVRDLSIRDLKILKYVVRTSSLQETINREVERHSFFGVCRSAYSNGFVDLNRIFELHGDGEACFDYVDSAYIKFVNGDSFDKNGFLCAIREMITGTSGAWDQNVGYLMSEGFASFLRLYGMYDDCDVTDDDSFVQELAELINSTPPLVLF